MSTTSATPGTQIRIQSTARQRTTRGAAAVDAPPMLVRLKELPGPLSLHKLAGLGAIQPLDHANAYHLAYAATAEGRGALIASMMAYGTIACMMTAAWVWLGGNFPSTFDIVSSSHFRTPLFGRNIRTFNKKTPENQRTCIGGLELTTPARTACDMAVCSDAELDHINAEQNVRALMREYRFTSAECIGILEENHFWQNAPRARRFFNAIDESS